MVRAAARTRVVCSYSAGAPAMCTVTRRAAVALTGTALATAVLLPRSASASLLRFPTSELRNRYFLVRAGESAAEAEDITLTNPAWKTSQAAGLSERGRAQVLQGTLPSLRRLGACSEGCWLWASVTLSSYQAAEALARVLDVGRSQLVPEYSFLDARGAGALETRRYAAARAMLEEGDASDPEWRPPKGSDGTPNESTLDVLVRLRQALSVMETQYSGEDVLVVTPDSDTLSMLQAAVLGVDLRQHHLFALRSGEVRELQLQQTQG